MCTGSVERLLLAVGGGDRGRPRVAHAAVSLPPTTARVAFSPPLDPPDGEDGDDGEDLSRAYRQLAEECAAAVSRGGYACEVLAVRLPSASPDPDGDAGGTSLADSAARMERTRRAGDADAPATGGSSPATSGPRTGGAPTSTSRRSPASPSPSPGAMGNDNNNNAGSGTMDLVGSGVVGSILGGSVGARESGEAQERSEWGALGLRGTGTDKEELTGKEGEEATRREFQGSNRGWGIALG